jgi:uncharacterized protein (DUF1330 family)
MRSAYKVVFAGLMGIALGAIAMAALAAQASPPAFYIANIQDVKDARAYTAYTAKVVDTLTPYAGRFIVRGAEPVILDASKKPPGYIVVIQFPAMKNLHDWWDSPAYSSIRPIRERLTTGQAYAVEGLAP